MYKLRVFRLGTLVQLMQDFLQVLKYANRKKIELRHLDGRLGV